MRRMAACVTQLFLHFFFCSSLAKRRSKVKKKKDAQQHFGPNTAPHCKDTTLRAEKRAKRTVEVAINHRSKRKKTLTYSHLRHRSKIEPSASNTEHTHAQKKLIPSSHDLASLPFHILSPPLLFLPLRLPQPLFQRPHLPSQTFKHPPLFGDPAFRHLMTPSRSPRLRPCECRSSVRQFGRLQDLFRANDDLFHALQRSFCGTVRSVGVMFRVGGADGAWGL